MLTESEGENIEEYFGVGVRIEVTVVLLLDFLRELSGIRQVAVVRKRHAERGVDEERLSLELTATAGSGVAHVTDAHRTLQSLE